MLHHMVWIILNFLALFDVVHLLSHHLGDPRLAQLVRFLTLVLQLLDMWHEDLLRAAEILQGLHKRMEPEDRLLHDQLVVNDQMVFALELLDGRD